MNKEKLFYWFRQTSIGSILGGLRTFFYQYLYNYRKHLGYCDPSATLSRPLNIKGPQNVFLYEDTKIANATIMATSHKFIMKKHSSAVEGITISTGNHDRLIGRYFRLIKPSEKRQGLGGDVIVEEDCWIGVNVTILMGVTVRRGTTVAAGAVLTKSTAPYAVWGGVPAKHIKFYWNIDQIMEHEAALYPPEERYSRTQLESFFSMYS